VAKVRRTLSLTEADAIEHRRRFIEFSRLELATGGPDHHLYTIAKLARETDDKRTAAWMIGCYMGPYNIPGGLVINNYWSASQVLDGPVALEAWLRANWAGIPFRRERRPARAPHRLAPYLTSYATWLDWLFANGPETLTYNELWESLEDVKTIGRYSGMKLLEGLRRAGVTRAEMPDLRIGTGGDWSPRLSLSYMYPKYDELFNRTQGRVASKRIEQFADGLYRDYYKDEIDLPDVYHFEVLLCDYKQSVDGKYYPGRPLDSEIGQLYKARAAFPAIDFDRVFEIRRELFDECYLGEYKNRWSDRREALGETMNQHGYYWTDARYNYVPSLDLANPVVWS